MAVTQSTAKRKGGNTNKNQAKQVKTTKKPRQATKHKAKIPKNTTDINGAFAKAIAEQVAKAVSEQVAEVIANTGKSSNNNDNDNFNDNDNAGRNNRLLLDEIAKTISEQTAEEVRKRVQVSKSTPAPAPANKKQTPNKKSQMKIKSIATKALRSLKQEVAKIPKKIRQNKKQSDAEKKKQAQKVIAALEARKRQRLQNTSFTDNNNNNTNADTNNNGVTNDTIINVSPVTTQTTTVVDSKADNNESQELPHRQVKTIVYRELAKAVLTAREALGGKQIGITTQIIDIAKTDYPWLKPSSLRKTIHRLKTEQTKHHQTQQAGEDAEQTTNKRNRLELDDDSDSDAEPAAKKQKSTNTSSTNNTNLSKTSASRVKHPINNVAPSGTSPRPPIVPGARKGGKVTLISIAKPVIQYLKKEVKMMTKELAEKDQIKAQQIAAKKKREVEAAKLRASVHSPQTSHYWREVLSVNQQTNYTGEPNDNHKAIVVDGAASAYANRNNAVIEVVDDDDDDDDDQAETDNDDEDGGGGGKPPTQAVVNAQAQQHTTQDRAIPFLDSFRMPPPVTTTNSVGKGMKQKGKQTTSKTNYNKGQDVPHRQILNKVYRELATVILKAREAANGKRNGTILEMANLAKADFPWLKLNSLSKAVQRLRLEETKQQKTQRVEEEEDKEKEDTGNEHDGTQVDSTRELTEEEKAIIETKRKAVYNEVTDKLLALRKQHSNRRHLPGGHFSTAIKEACIKHNLDESFIKKCSIQRRVGRFQLPPDVVNNAHITLRSLAHTSPDYVKKIQKFLDPFKARSKRTEILSHQFWRIYAESEDDALSKFETCPNPSFLVKPMKELIEYQTLFDAAKTWKSTSDGRPRMIRLVRKQLQFVIQKCQEWDAVNWQDQSGDSNDRETNDDLGWSCLSPKEWSTIISSLLLLSYQEKFCEDFSQEKAELECQLRTFRLHSFEMKKVETYWCVTCGRSCSCMNVCMDCGTTVTQQKDGESIFRDAFDALLKSSIDNTSSSRDRIKQPLLLSDGSHWGHIGWLYCEAMRKYDEKYQW